MCRLVHFVCSDLVGEAPRGGASPDSTSDPGAEGSPSAPPVEDTLSLEELGATCTHSLPMAPRDTSHPCPRLRCHGRGCSSLHIPARFHDSVCDVMGGGARLFSSPHVSTTQSTMSWAGVLVSSHPRPCPRLSLRCIVWGGAGEGVFVSLLGWAVSSRAVPDVPACSSRPTHQSVCAIAPPPPRMSMQLRKVGT